MAEILYLDIDDEITSAAARIRSARDVRVALVLPTGSRLATSRINFRLLAREAQAHHRNLSIVAPEGSARSLAASAGLAAYGTVGEFEDVVDAEERTRVEGRTEASGSASGSVGSVGSSGAQDVDQPKGPKLSVDRGGVDSAMAETAGGAPSQGGRSERTRDHRDPEPSSLPIASGRQRGRLRRTILAIMGAFVALALVAGGVGAYLLLPSATIVVRPHDETIGPLRFTVRADPAATAVDPSLGVVPAQLVAFDLSASGVFQATGKRVDEAPATGSVRFRNCDPGNSYRIRAGSTVGTSAGIRFTTDSEVFLPVAIFDPATSKVACQNGEVGVTAVAPGPAGNVGPGTITHVPSNVNANLVFVTNPAAASGGKHEEFPKVVQKDVDKAKASLTKQLSQQFDSQLASPSSTPGTTLFPQTKSMSPPVPTVDPATIVDQEVASFELGMTATGNVTAVDTSAVTQVGEQQLRASITPGRTLVDGSTQVTVGNPMVEGSVVAFPVTATAKQMRQIDQGQLVRDVKGKTIPEARSILGSYGDVQIDVWPSWVSAIPTLDFRLDLKVAGPSAPGGSGPASSTAPGVSASTSPGRSPAASKSSPRTTPSPSGTPTSRPTSTPRSSSASSQNSPSAAP